MINDTLNKTGIQVYFSGALDRKAWLEISMLSWPLTNQGDVKLVFDGNFHVPDAARQYVTNFTVNLFGML